MTRTPASPQLKTWLFRLAVIGLLLLLALPRLTALNRYRIVDEADRWRWAEEFVLALHAGDLAATLVGDGYPGIVPVWAESAWVLGEAARRSLAEGQWLGDAGLGKLFHEWDRSDYLYQQRLPIVLLNTALALAIIVLVWRLFGGRVALLAGLLIALDPFYLSDSRVNRAEALITGLMTLSVLWLIFYARTGRTRYALLSGIFGGLSFLTKIQALAMLPALGLIGLWIYWQNSRQSGGLWPPRREHVLPIIGLGAMWTLAAATTWLLLWPAMWVVPLETLTLVYNYTTRKVGAEGVSLFFMGQTYSDADPGPLFYPVVLLLRITPLALLGLVAAAIFSWRWRTPGRAPSDCPNRDGSAFLLIYALAYALAMTLGSHKQDRYLLPIFLALDILAAIGLVFFWVWLKDRWGAGAQGRKGARAQGRRGARAQGRNSQSAIHNSQFTIHNSQFLWGGVLLAAAVALQLATALPHHPYYYSYFNPLAGGGAVAAQTLRIGWGEGMDLAAAYLAAKPNSERLVVSSRFTHNMLGFPGELISQTNDGRWTRADYVVLYIQQTQRRLDPSPAFLDYFQSHRAPEKVITLGGIDYAWIYPRPFAAPANPDISRIDGQAALLGYSWEAGSKSANEQSPDNSHIRTFAHSHIRLLWENLGLTEGRQLTARLTGEADATGWSECRPDPAFTITPGAYVESVCAPAVAALPPGLYNVEFGLRDAVGNIAPFEFPAGRLAARVTAAGVELLPETEHLEALAAAALPAAAAPLDRVFEAQIRLLGYHLEPAQPTPGETVTLTLYWQPVRDLIESAHLTVQLADSRSLPLGRADAPLFNLGQGDWPPGEVIATRHTFPLPPELDSPLAAQIEVALTNAAAVPLRPTTAAGQPLEAAIGRFTVAPAQWPAANPSEAVSARWANGMELLGYRLPPDAPAGQEIPVTLLWRTAQPVNDNLVAFVHLVDAGGQLRAQHDAIPRLGAYPTEWWRPGAVIEDTHPLALPPALPPGAYKLLVGLYRAADGARLPLQSGGDAVPLAEISLP